MGPSTTDKGELGQLGSTKEVGSDLSFLGSFSIHKCFVTDHNLPIKNRKYESVKPTPGVQIFDDWLKPCTT